MAPPRSNTGAIRRSHLVITIVAVAWISCHLLFFNSAPRPSPTILSKTAKIGSSWVRSSEKVTIADVKANVTSPATQHLADTSVVRSNLPDTPDVRSREKVTVFQGQCSGTKIKSQEREKDGCLRYGTPYGGHELPGRLDLFRRGDVYVGVGCGEDISFDLSIAAAFGVSIHLLDPTPRAMLHVGAVTDRIAANSPPVYFAGSSDQYSWNGSTLQISGKVNAKEWWSEVLRANLDPAGINFYPWGLSIADDNMTFVPPRSGVSHSLSAQGDGAKGAFTVPVKSFQSIVHVLKDAKVGMLKIDIEGHEVDPKSSTPTPKPRALNPKP